MLLGSLSDWTWVDCWQKSSIHLMDSKGNNKMTPLLVLYTVLKAYLQYDNSTVMGMAKGVPEGTEW